MSNPYEHNPFEVLQLDPGSSNEQVVAQAARLRQRSLEEQDLADVRQAVQALTGRSEERLVHEMLTHPRPCYQQPLLEQLRTTFRRPPRLPRRPAQACPALDLTQFASLLRPVFGEEWDMAALPFREALMAESAGEISRQSAEAAWQCLVEAFLA